MILIHTSLYASIVVVLSFMTNCIEPHSPRVKAAFQATLNLVFGPTAYCTRSCRTGLENLIGSYAGLDPQHSTARNTYSTAALPKSNLGQFSQNSQRWTWATRTRAFGLIVSFIIFGHCLPVCGCRW